MIIINSDKEFKEAVKKMGMAINTLVMVEEASNVFEKVRKITKQKLEEKKRALT